MTENEKMRFYRECMGWTLNDYAKLSGFSKEYISITERGKRSVSAHYAKKMKEVIAEHSGEFAERMAALMEVMPASNKIS